MPFTLQGGVAHGNLASAASVTVAVTAAAGSVIVCWGYSENSTSGFGTITDNAGNAGYTNGAVVNDGVRQNGTAANVGLTGAGIANAITSVTYTPPATATTCGLLVWAYTPSGGVVVIADSAATLYNFNSTNVTDGIATRVLVLTSSDGLIVSGAVDLSSGTLTHGTGFTNDITGFFAVGEHRSATSSAIASWTCAANGDLVEMAGIALQIASAAAGDTTTARPVQLPGLKLGTPVSRLRSAVLDTGTTLPPLIDRTAGSVPRLLRLGTPVSRLRSAVLDTGTSGTGVTTGPLFGVAVATTVATGALSATGALAGTAVTTSAAVGALSASGVLSGVSVASSAATGLLTGVGNLVGTAVTTTVAAGNLQASGALSGVSISVSVAAGALGGTGALSGVSTTTSVAAGDLEPFSSGATSGVSVSSSYGIGALVGIGVLSGTAVATSTDVGGLSGSGVLSGVAVSSTNATGGLSAVGILAGVAASTTILVANLSGPGVLSGIAIATTLAIGDLQPFSAGSTSGIAVATSYGVGQISFTFTPPVISQTGSVPGFVKGGKPRKKDEPGPTMREGQVFGEEYAPAPIAQSPVTVLAPADSAGGSLRLDARLSGLSNAQLTTPLKSEGKTSQPRKESRRAKLQARNRRAIIEAMLRELL